MSQLIPNTAQLVVRGTDPNGRKWANVLYHTITPPLTQSQLDTICEPIQDAYELMLPAQHTAYHVTDILGTDLSSAGGPQFTSTAGFPITGSNANAPLPAQVAALISLYSSFRGKAGRGRIYLCGFTEDASQGDGPTSSVTALLNGFAGQILAGTNVVVASRFEGVAPATKGSRRMRPVPRVTGVTNPLHAVFPHNTWSTQRRRALRS